MQKSLLLFSLDKVDKESLHAMKAYGGSKDTAPHILNLGTRQRLLL
jgi:hypothetical protein